MLSQNFCLWEKLTGVEGDVFLDLEGGERVWFGMG